MKKPQWLEVPRCVEVLWEDHHVDMTESPRPYLIQSIGYKTYEDNVVITLAPSIGEKNNRWKDEEITILKKCIVRKRVV